VRSRCFVDTVVQVQSCCSKTQTTCTCTPAPNISTGWWYCFDIVNRYDRLEVDVSDDAVLELQHVQVVVVDAVVMSLLLLLMRIAVVLGLCLSPG
jgi:hypothetical protein